MADSKSIFIDEISTVDCEREVEMKKGEESLRDLSRKGP